MPMPVIRQPVFQLEPLAGEPEVLRQRAARGVDAAEGFVARPPHVGLGAVGEHDPVAAVASDGPYYFLRLR
jgi:hypothetical protein